MIRAVTFDFWNTLMWEEPGSLRFRRLESWRQFLDDARISIDFASLARAHDVAHARYESSWRAGKQFVAQDAATLIAHEVQELNSPVLMPLLLEGFNEGGRRAAIEPCDGVAQCLDQMKAAGIRLGIICDIGLTPSPVVRELLRRHALLEFFDDAAFSDEVGFYKPDPAIFAHALQSLRVRDPADAAHVGDRRRTDVAGAMGAGMMAVRYNAIYEDVSADAPEAHIVIDELATLPVALGVSAVSS